MSAEERPRSETAAEARYRITLASIGDGVISTDAQGRVDFMNLAAQRLTGWTDSEARGRPIQEVFRIINEETRAQVENPLARVLREGVVVGLANHTVLVAKDGIERPIADSGAPIRDEKGAITGVVLVFRDQTDERAAQRLLQESERRYRTLAESLPHLVWTCRADGPCDYLSPLWVAYTGISEADQLGYRWLEQLHPDDRERVMAEWSEVAPRGNVFDIEFRIRRKDGEHRWFKTRAIPFRDSEGRVVKWFGSNTDIDDYKQAEQALKDARDRLEEAQRVARAGSWKWNTAKDEITGSAEFYRLFDVAPEGLARFSQFTDRLHPDDRERVQRDVAEALKQDRPYDTDYRVQLTNGGWRDINARGQLLADAEGKTASLVGTCLDITERKQAERALRASEAQYRTVVDNIPQKVFVKGRDFRWVSVNLLFAHDLGKKPEEIVGKNDYDLFPKDLADKYRADDKRIMETGATDEYDEEYVEKGELRIVHTIKTPVRDEAGTITGVLGVFWDVTERRRAEEALRTSNEALLRSNQELEQFAYVASHDLQEPLRMVSSYTQLLAQRYNDKLDQDAMDFIGYAVDGANRMQRLIEDLLKYSRVATRGQPPTLLDTHDALGEAVRNLQAAIQETGALVTNDDLPRVLGDQIQIVQIFQNLVANGIKFHKPGEPPRVHVSAERNVEQPSFWTFKVADNGIGIEPRHFARLFVIFQRLNGKQEYPGTGIGLALCKRIVERHGGKIWIESKAGKGTTLFFTLPSVERGKGLLR